MLRLTKLPLASKVHIQRQLAAGVPQGFNSKLEFSLESDVFLKCNPGPSGEPALPPRETATDMIPGPGAMAPPVYWVRVLG